MFTNKSAVFSTVKQNRRLFLNNKLIQQEKNKQITHTHLVDVYVYTEYSSYLVPFRQTLIGTLSSLHSAYRPTLPLFLLPSLLLFRPSDSSSSAHQSSSVICRVSPAHLYRPTVRRHRVRHLLHCSSTTAVTCQGSHKQLRQRVTSSFSSYT